ncbi:ARF guanine-nucleotide exchange factor GNL2 [Salvia hispanica]|uniref:ARF guanine-nucleotide exchange factor GNL2 n=1 Tax=Salvia hispanica TaxID=49212 RepID=UPI0020098CC6|nr:ARF guanine-nucleotide exchange factor GNL2 [Salvia hispanica]
MTSSLGVLKRFSRSRLTEIGIDRVMEDDGNKTSLTKSKRKDLGLSCMLNAEVGAVLAVIRRPPDPNYHQPDEGCDTSISQSLKSLRAMLFKPQQEWRTIDPSVYMSPFLDVIQSDDIPASATAAALQSVLKILRLGIFDEKTQGGKESINAAVNAVTSCRLEKTNPVTEDAVMMRILQALTAVMRHRASILLTDHSTCTLVNTCFQVVQQTANRVDLLQRCARYTMHELIQIIFSRMPDIEVKDWENSESDTEDNDLDSGYGISSAVDIFHFLCSLLNVVDVDTDMVSYQTSDENTQVFALYLINSAIELSGDSIGKHPKLLRMIQDDLFHHLIHYGLSSTPLVLSMISSTVLNLYHFLRSSVRLQLEAFFSFVLFKVAAPGSSLQLQEVAIEAIINFCRQPNFSMEAYVNYDSDTSFRNVFEETGKLLCKYAFPTGTYLTSTQIQSFEGLSVILHYIADNIDREDDTSPSGPYPVEITEFRPFWEDKVRGDDVEAWIEFLRFRKVQKRKILIAGSHFNRDEKKGLDYLKKAGLTSDPPDPKAFAYFFRYTPKLNKTMIGDYLGDPDALNVQVLKEFTHTFEFSGMHLDSSLRTYLESFRLPGESQKIQRVVEAFSERFYEQQSSDLFASKDAVMIFCYSIIMLNTDQHNPQVKKKMSEEEFIKNNRSINGGNDLPREYLSELFQSIATNAIKMDDTNIVVEMNPNRWIQLINRSKIVQPFIMCDFDRRLGRDMFASIAGPSVATVAAVFEHSDEEEMLHDCIESLFSIARISQYGLEDTLDELICSFSKFTTLLNPYASAEETLYAFSHDMKPKMAILAVFTIVNVFKDSIRGGWRTIIECLLKLKRLKLLPQSIMEPEMAPKSPATKPDSAIVIPSNDPKYSKKRQASGITAKFLTFMSMENVEESLNQGMNEFEQNISIIQQCQIGSIFSTSSNLPEESLLNLGRCIIFAAAGKGQKFSTPVEEEETVSFCWELISSMALANRHRVSTFWPYYHDYLLEVTQFPLFSPIPFSEKAIVSLMKMCLKLLASDNFADGAEELIFKSFNLMWRVEKEILETCCEFLLQAASKIITDYPNKMQTQLGWMSVLHLLSVTGRHPETYDQGVETLIHLMTDQNHITRTNYTYCIDCAFAFVALRNSQVDKNIKIMDMLAESASLLVEWYKGGYSDPGSGTGVGNNGNSLSVEESSRIYNPISFFQRLGESLKKTSLARREEVRNHAVLSLQRSFLLAEDLLFTPTSCINSFYNIIFAMVDDLHEKMLQYSRRDNAERETRSMEGTLKLSMEVLTHLYLHFLKPISESNNFRTFWLGILRRMDTCMKADLGEYGESKLPNIIPELLKNMVMTMKEQDVLKISEEDDLWDITFVQIQWIAPSLTDELFPEGV